MIVEKAVKMAKLMNIPIIGIIENMSYYECPDCGKKINIFGESHTKQISAEHGIKLLAELPMDPSLASLVDAGKIEDIDAKYLDALTENLEMKN